MLRTPKDIKEGMTTSSNAVCPLHTCGAIDPVSDPEYNMKEIIKQSLLLEDHMVEKNKRCMDCCVKHFMTIIAYACESVSLAGNSVTKYPYMKENPEYYNTLFQYWLDNRDKGDEVFLKTAEGLRSRRKELVALYVLKTTN
jgi:hypothetical protein